MNIFKISIAVFFLLIFVSAPAFPVESSPQDSLPIGPSQYKFIIDKIEDGKIMDTATAKTVALEDIIQQTADTQVYIIGEAHDNYKCHTFQRDFVAALHKKHPRLIIGFEFFMRDDNDALELWRQGKITEKELIEKTGWYKRSALNYGYTRLIMDLLKQNKIKPIGLNVPRTILRKVSRQGFDKLSEEEKKLFPTLNVANPEHEYFIKGIFGTFAVQVPFWFKNMYNAQKCWDVVMAESMRTMLAKEEYKDYKGVIIAGSNHVAYKLGIPFRYTCAEENVKLTTIVPVLLREEEPSGDGDDEMHPMMKMMGGSLAPAVTFSRGIADYVFAVPQPLVRFFPTLGVTIKEKQGKIKVTRVAKKSLAQRSGLVKGDVITAFDGVELKTIQQLRTLLAVKKWGDSVSFKVEKKIELKKPAPPKKAAAPAKKEGGPPKGMGTMPSMGGKSKEKKK